MTFELSETQVEKFNKWRKKLKPIPPAAIGGGFSFTFTPIGIGTVVEVTRIDGKKLDLTEDDKW